MLKAIISQVESSLNGAHIAGPMEIEISLVEAVCTLSACKSTTHNDKYILNLCSSAFTASINLNNEIKYKTGEANVGLYFLIFKVGLR